MKTTSSNSKGNGRPTFGPRTPSLASAPALQACLGNTTCKHVPTAHPRSRRRKNKNTQTPFAKILVPVDFSRDSRKAIIHAKALADRFASCIYLLYVAEPRSCAADFGYGQVMLQIPDKNWKTSAEWKLKAMAREIVGTACPCHTMVLQGPAHQMIVEAANSLGIDLIVMLAHDHANVGDAVLTSMTENTVRHATCPVLVVRK